MKLQEVMECVRKGVDEALEQAHNDCVELAALEKYLIAAAGGALDEYMKRQTVEERTRREELQRDRHQS